MAEGGRRDTSFSSGPGLRIGLLMSASGRLSSLIVPQSQANWIFAYLGAKARRVVTQINDESVQGWELLNIPAYHLYEFIQIR